MNRIKYDSDLIKIITLFESMSGAKVRDCISNDRLLFIVEENEIGRAIGKNGANIRKMESALKKKIKVAEFSNDILKFIRSLAHPAEIVDVKNDNGMITIFGKDTNARAMLIGRDKQNLHHLNETVKRYFEIKGIRVE